jgi:hypothetical protein
MSTAASRSPLGSGANNLCSGVISTGASWIEDIEFSVDGAPITDADDFEWQFNFRKDYCNSSPDLSLSTSETAR